MEGVDEKKKLPTKNKVVFNLNRKRLRSKNTNFIVKLWFLNIIRFRPFWYASKISWQKHLFFVKVSNNSDGEGGQNFVDMSAIFPIFVLTFSLSKLRRWLVPSPSPRLNPLVPSWWMHLSKNYLMIELLNLNHEYLRKLKGQTDKNVPFL